MFETPDEDNRDTKKLPNNARNIEETCSLFTEIVHHQDKDIIRCKVCASEQDIKQDQGICADLLDFDCYLDLDFYDIFIFCDISFSYISVLVTFQFC